MKTLLYKQLRLVCQPMTLVFCLFGVMLLIPAYPYTVMWFYVMLGLFFSFLNGREQKDVYYSALLPIRKRDTDVYKRQLLSRPSSPMSPITATRRRQSVSARMVSAAAMA